MLELVILSIPAYGCIALLFVFWKSFWISRQPAGNEKMQQISLAISNGSKAFLKTEYKILGLFILSVSAILLAGGMLREDPNPFLAFAFLSGAACSMLAGFIGMNIAIEANVRTAEAARSGLGKALRVAFNGGTVMGFGVAGLALLGIGLLLILLRNLIGTESVEFQRKTITLLTGFSFGASTVALFARVGGGIFTKAADIGADMVGKAEEEIPEDHPLNPAVIADNVGDNVGDVAGMGADLFESFAGSIISAMLLGVGLLRVRQDLDYEGMGAILLPPVLAGAGILVSILSTVFVRGNESRSPSNALNRGTFVSALLMVPTSYFVCSQMLQEEWIYKDVLYSTERTLSSTGIFYAVCIGILCGLLIGAVTEYFTRSGGRPVKNIVRRSAAGAATNILEGLSLGMKSAVLPVLLIAGAIIGSFHFAGLYGIAIAAVGMLSTTGIQLALDAFGPISDNAGGIAAMAGLPKEVRTITDKLDAAGNTTAAIGKGFATASAALTGLALFGAFMMAADLRSISISKPEVVAGLLIGAMIPFLFSALALSAVSRAAGKMILEVRRQFAEIPELKQALAILKKNETREFDTWAETDKKILEAAEQKAEYGKCVEISAKAAIREMMIPGILAILVPVLTGVFLGTEALGGLLAGVTVTGVVLALFQANAGGAWDNAKKMMEAGTDIDGRNYSKNSDAYRSAVIGDTVGDPFKDTSAPSINILIKLMAIVALILAPFITIQKVIPQELVDHRDVFEKRGFIKQNGNYILDSLESRVEWTGRKSTGMHTGTLQLLSGELHVNGGIVTQGKLAVGINTMKCTDISNKEDNQSLVEHLKDKDFFNAAEYPEANFEINQLVKEASGDGYRITGNLTIKGITKEISFPATINSLENKIYASADLKINRTDFGIKFKSKTFFKDLGDKFIYDEFELRLALVGKIAGGN